MRIVFDARAFAWTGIGRYIQNLLKGYCRIPHNHSFVVLVPRNSLKVAQRTLSLPIGSTFKPVESTYYSLREQTQLLWELQLIKADLFHFTHFNIPFFFRRPYVLTVHDVTRFIFPGQRKKGLLHQVVYEMVFARAIARANTLIAVSNSTRQELQMLPLKLPKRFSVIQEGVNDVVKEISVLSRRKARLLLGTPDRYILYVGVWMSHKNLTRLIRAFKEVRERHSILKLVITGKPVPGYSDLLETVRKLSMERHIIFPGYVDEELLPALYLEAECFVFPSLYEGFGLPPLEAAALGTPVVCSNNSSLPEVMGTAPVYINPEDEHDIARGIIHSLEHTDDRKQSREERMQIISKNNWDECARKTLREYESVPRHRVGGVAQ